MLEKRKRQMWKLAALIYPFIVFMTIKLAPYTGSSLAEFIDNSDQAMTGNPFSFQWSDKTPRLIVAVSIVYFTGMYIYITSMKNTRYGEEYGSARWEEAKRLGRKYRAHATPGEFVRENFRKLKIGYMGFKLWKLRRSKDANIEDICSLEAEKEALLLKEIRELPYWRRNVQMSEYVKINIQSKQDNINTLILGGSGTGKSRSHIIPNIMQLNSSFICTDPKGEILRKTGNLLKLAGYDIRVLDLKNHNKSHGYNPFVYFRNDDDVLLFVNNMWSAMEDKAATKQDQMWSDLAKTMLMSFILFIFHYCPIEEQNFDTVMHMYHQIEITEQKGEPSILDKIYDKIPEDDPAYGYYKDWSVAQGRTLASICSTFSSRMTVFNLDSMKSLTYKDEMGITDLATKKVAIFLLLPDDNAVYNFLAGTLYTQTFQQLYDYADNVVHGALPQHVRFYMDEFANIALPNDYQKILSTARSRNMSFVIVLQDKQQIEAIFEKYYRTIYGNCSTYLFLGSGELETCKYYSELLGDETVVVYNWTKNYGRNSGMSRSENRVARKLMTPDEVKKLDKKECIVYINNEYAVKDNKTDMTQHRYYRFISDGEFEEANRYDWGTCDDAIGDITVLSNSYGGHLDTLPETKEKWVLLSDEEIEKMIRSRWKAA